MTTPSKPSVQRPQTLAIAALTLTLSVMGATTAHAQSGPCPLSPTPLAQFNVKTHAGSTKWIRVTQGVAEPVYSFPGGTPIGSQIAYSLEYCGGASYTLTVSHTTGEFAIEVYDANGALKIMLLAPEGAGLTIENGVGTAVGTAFSPFVLRNTALGRHDMNALLLVDEQVLNSLPVPDQGSGAFGGGATYRQSVWQTLVGDNSVLYDTFRFRWYLSDLASADLSSLEAMIADYTTNGDALLIHNATGIPGVDTTDMTDDYGVNHSVGLAPIDETLGYYGGFWNGHRYLMRDAEDYLAAMGAAYTPPFGRMPSWQPSEGAPTEFNPSTPVGDTIPSTLYAGTVCNQFPNASDVTDSNPSTGLFGFTKAWHGDVHTQSVGGASDSLFYPWHTTVDTVWANWKQCQIP